MRAPGANRSASSLAASTTKLPSSPCGRPTRPTVTQALVNDLEDGALVPASAARADERAERASDSTLAADHLADVVGGDVQLEHDRTLTLAPDYAHRARLVHEAPGQVLEQVLHSDALGLHQAPDRVARLRPLRDPVLDLLRVEVDRRGLRLGVVASHDLDEAPVARGARVGHDDAVDGVFLRAHAGQSDPCCHSVLS